MSVLTTLKLVTSKRPAVLSPIVVRRKKLIDKLHEQVLMCKSSKDGEKYAPLKMRTYINRTTGERITKQVPKRVREWFFIDSNGKIHLTVRYGTRQLNLNKKGANAIECTSGDELISILENLKQAVNNGELDSAIEEASSFTRTAFGK